MRASGASNTGQASIVKGHDMTPSDPSSNGQVKKCKRGHLYDGNKHQCPECSRLAQAKYRQVNREKILAGYKKYREEHAVERKAGWKKWFSKNKDKNNSDCRERNRKNKEYLAYRNIIYRCTNPRCRTFKDYGGRGITVCERWSGVDGFNNFSADMGERPSSKHEIDRRDNSLGYFPENCHWVTDREQSRNKRSNRMITFNEKTQCLTDWATERGMKPATLFTRLNLGWPVHDALTIPVGKAHRG